MKKVSNYFYVLSFLIVNSSILFSQLPAYVPANGLQGWWSFNGDANDASGNNINGIIHGAIPGPDRTGSGGSYFFNGVSSWIDLGDNPLLNAGLSDITFSAWIMAPSTNGARIFSKGSHGGIQPGYAMNVYPNGTGNVAGVFCAGSPNPEVLTFTNNPVSDDSWHFMTTVIDRDDVMKIYVDGILQSTVDISSYANIPIGESTYNATIGVSYSANGMPGNFDEYFWGLIDDVGFWSRALNECEIQQLYNSQITITPTITNLTDLTGSCSYSAPTAPTATNDCGDILTGTTSTTFPITTQGTTVITWTYTDGINTLTQNQNVITGPVNYSVSPLTQSICPNSSTTINLANSTVGVNYYLRDDSDNSIVDGPIVGTGGPILFTTNNVTTSTNYNVYAAIPSLGLNCGVYNATYDGSALLNLTNNLTIETWVYPRNAINSKLVHKSPIGSGYILGLNGGQLFPQIWDNMGVLYQSAAGTVPTNQWSHVAMTWETGGFFTGYVNGVQVFQIPASSNPISVNGTTARLGEFPFDGILDEVRIWNTTRTNTEISNNMFSCLTGSESGLVTYHKMNHPANTATAQDATANNIKVTPVDVSSQFGINGIDVCSTCSSEMTQIATVTIDDVAPIAICQNATVNLDESGFGTLLASAVDNGSTDNCSIASFSVSPSTFSCSNLGSNTSIFTTTDISGNSATCSFDVLVEFPAVTNLGVTNILPDATAITWNTGNIQGFGWYSFRYKQTSSGTWINYGTITGSAISKVISGLSPGTEYEAQIKRHANAQCTSAWSSSVIFTTTSSGCGVPMVFNTPTVSSNSVTVTWSAVSGAAWYEFQYKTVSSGTWINAGTLAGTATSKIFAGLTAGTAYNFRGRTFCPGGTPSPWSAIANATTSSTASGCSLPPVLAATAVNASNITLSWTAVSGAAWYEFRYSSVSATGPWTSGGTLGGASTSKSFTGLTQNITYYFEARTYCSNGMPSAWGALQATTTTPTGCQLPPVLTATTVLATTATITWPAVAGASWYEFRYKPTASGTWLTAGTLAGTGTTKTLTGLTAGTQYDFQARTFCSNGLANAWSNTLQFTTASLMSLQPKPGSDLANDKVLENTNIDVNVYPNPTNNLVNIETIFEEADAAILVKVIDMNGRTVLEMNALSVEGKNAIQLSLENMNVGIYNLEIYNNNELIDRSKVIKTN